VFDPIRWDDDGAALELVLGKLSGVRKHGGYWMARCPAHDDAHASLSIARGTSQPVVFKCHAGCDRDAILDALGLELTDVSAQHEREMGEWTPQGPAVATYNYTDEQGTVLFQVVRTADKHFLQRVPDSLSKSGWRWRLGDTRRVLYRLPKVLAAIDRGETVWVVEGEKDVHSLEGAGVTATCNPHGAGSWREEYAKIFRDAAVCVVADADSKGRAHARAVASSLGAVGATVTVLEAAAGKDASDHLAAGKGLAEFVTTREADSSRTLRAIDLNAFLAIPDEPQRWVLKDLLEHGDRLLLTGGEGLGKSSCTRQLAVCAAAGLHPFTGYFGKPQRVLYVDCENSERKSRRRFRPLAATAAHHQRPIPNDGFMILHQPRGIDLSKEEGAAWLAEQVTAYRPDMLVCGPLYKLHAIDANEEHSARAIVAALEAAIEISDCALVTEAHSAKGPDGSRPLTPAGSRIFLGWPDMGYGLRRVNGDRKRVRFLAWRGDREERSWPGELCWGKGYLDWPWVVPTDPAPDYDGDDPYV
jgi:hypothetical protein